MRILTELIARMPGAGSQGNSYEGRPPVPWYVHEHHKIATKACITTLMHNFVATGHPDLARAVFQEAQKRGLVEEEDVIQ